MLRGLLKQVAEAAAEAVAAVNHDPDQLARLAANLPPAEWRITGCDPDGCDLRAGAEVARIPFPQSTAAADLAATLRNLAQGRGA